MSLSSVRHVPIFVTVTAPVIASEIASWWKAWTNAARKASLVGIVNQMAADSMKSFRRSSAWPAAAIVALVLIGRPIPWPKDFAPEVFPVKLIHEHEADVFNVRLMTTDQWADYLIYLNPGQKVFIDGRSDFYGPEIGNQYIRLMGGQKDWQELMQKYAFTSALLPVDSALPQLLKMRPDWRVVEDDGKRILLVRTGTPVPSRRVPGAEPRF
jgi:hypothetical protein